jgi:DNA-binding LytR/AlgR family response regulator
VIHVAIVEDQRANRADLVEHLARYSETNGVEFTIAEFSDGTQIVNDYRPQYDVILLDVEMADMDGFETAHRIRAVDSNVVIIFVTNMAQYAIKGYEVDALSYLVKPVPYFAFSQELDRTLARVHRQESDALVLKANGNTSRVDLADIVYIEAVKHRITVHTLSAMYTFSGTLKSLEERLDGKGFYRSNNPYLVNLRHVTTVGAQSCVMVDGTELQVSRPRRRGFLDALTDFVGGAS